MKVFFHNLAPHPALLPILKSAQSPQVRVDFFLSQVRGLREQLWDPSGPLGLTGIARFFVSHRLRQLEKFARDYSVDGLISREYLRLPLQAAFEVWPYEEIGKGGLGSVYAGYDQSTGRKVAVKIANGEVPLGAAESALRLEAGYLGVLNRMKAQVPGLIDSGSVDDKTYLTMEFLEGENLHERLTNLHHGKLGPDELNEMFAIAEKCAEALAKVHDEGRIVHRDIKPTNFMVCRDGSVILIDFGLACLAGSLRPDQWAGTPLFMPPESGNCGEPVSPRSDIFSFGVMLYELIAGSPPFRENGDWVELLTKMSFDAKNHQKPSEVLIGNRPSLEPYRRVLEQWDAVIMKALSKDQDERYKDAKVLLEAIRALPRVEKEAIPDETALQTG